MKILHALVGLLLMILLAVGTIYILWAAHSGETWEDLAQAASAGRVTWSCGAGALLCLVVIFALSAVPRQKRERYLSFDGEGGTVSISTAAICDYIAKLTQEFPSVVRLNPRVIPRRSMIDIVVDLRVKAGPNIHEACELMQQRVRESVTNGLGISQIGRIEVSVKDIVSEHRLV